MLNILLDQADININAKDVEGKTPIWWAINNGHSAVVSRLLAQSGLELDGTIRGQSLKYYYTMQVLLYYAIYTEAYTRPKKVMKTFRALSQ